MMVGKVKIHIKKQKKRGKEYLFPQAIIYVKREFLEQIKEYDNQDVTFIILDEKTKKEIRKREISSDLIRAVYFLLMGKSTRKADKEAIRELKKRLEELEKIL